MASPGSGLCESSTEINQIRAWQAEASTGNQEHLRSMKYREGQKRTASNLLAEESQKQVPQAAEEDGKALASAELLRHL